MIPGKLIWKVGFLLSGFFRQNSQHNLFLFISGDTKIDRSLISLAQLFTKRKPIFILAGTSISSLQISNSAISQFHFNAKRAFAQAFYSGVISKWIESSNDTVIVGANDSFFNSITLTVRKDIQKIIITNGDNWKNIGSKVLHKTDVIICDSEYQKHSASKSLVTNAENDPFSGVISAIHYYFELGTAPVHNPNTPPEVLFVYNGKESRQVRIMAETAKRALQGNLNVQFTFVGNVEEIINADELPNCNFYGTIQDYNTIRDILSQSDILIILEEDENVPPYLAEAMSLGKPVISQSSGTLTDFIEDGVNGFLIPKDTETRKMAEDIFIALATITSDSSTLQKMSEASAAKAGILFSKSTFINKWKKVIKI
ncbi:MAG: glycosyltransferase [Chitinophagaceae bacterium]|nr:glycosyltransferase [Chitinophagaceae bacterium]MCZ2397264.1 glycosyltransferase [Chitinophagales bacterium]